jgi:phosphoribosylamine--glycine ligase
MTKTGIATGRWSSFESPEKAVAYMDELGPPYVVKADGLAAGKGVVVTESRADAIRAVGTSLAGDGSRVVIEEFLHGEEVSVIAMTDGDAVVAFEPAQDYKRLLDHDRGPNTGGMGSYSPVPSCPAEVAERVLREVIQPIVRTTASLGAPFVGAIYAGLMLTADGPKVLEFNARFGDPETQALLPRLDSDFGELCLACASGELGGMRLSWRTEACVCVVVSARGYPQSHPTGDVIEGLDDASGLPGVEIFHAGTAVKDGQLVTAGGRVLAVSATAPKIARARALAYQACSMIHFSGRHLRSDIALRAETAERESL